MDMLLIEPHRGSRNALAALLELEGHRVITAANPATGLVEARWHEFDYILTEVVTPGALSAGDLIAGLRAADPEARIIVTSTVVDCDVLFELSPLLENPEAQARAAGADHCIAKPLDLDQLIELIELIESS